MAMSNDFGLFNLAGSPFLERIVREERLNEEQPRKSRYAKTGKAKKKNNSNEPDESQNNKNSLTSRHIDLRV
jgi:hypothetical protein